MVFRPEAGNLPPAPSESISTLPKSGLISFAFGFVIEFLSEKIAKDELGKETQSKPKTSCQFSSFPAFLIIPLWPPVRHSEQKCQSSPDRGTSHPVN